MTRPNGETGAFVISLDLELFWGVRDVKTLAECGARLRAGREAAAAMLERFARDDIHATWATVGFLAFDSREDLLRHLPSSQPHYRAARLSPYVDLDALGSSEAEDPHHFAPSLLRRIVATPGQELATHTFSHYYCLEEGQTVESFRADLDAAILTARERFDVELESIVFPRNQYDGSSLEICRSVGLVAFRGNQNHWLYRARRERDESLLRRGVRLLDHYVPLSGSNAVRPSRHVSGMIDVSASRFLKPYTPTFPSGDGVRLARIERDLERAARDKTVFHLWWHPHNFGAHQEENFAFLEEVLERFAKLRASFGLTSLTMAEAAHRYA